MKNQTAEEILDEYGCPSVPFDENVTMFYPAIIDAMHQFASQQSALAVAKRERQIGALLDQMLDEDHPKAFYKAVVQIREFLYPTSAEIAQVEPTKVDYLIQKGIDAMYDELIDKHLDILTRQPFTSSVQYFCESGKCSGNFRLQLRKLLKEHEDICRNAAEPEPFIPIREIERWIDAEVRDARGLLNLRKFQLWVQAKTKQS